MKKWEKKYLSFMANDAFLIRKEKQENSNLSTKEAKEILKVKFATGEVDQ